jgi:hypothetical protein
MLFGLFLLTLLIIKLITQYKFNKHYSKESNIVTKYRKVPFGVKDYFTQESLEKYIDVFSSSFNNDLYYT